MTDTPTAVTPRPASTICLFRSGTRSVLMAQRGATARFMASAWVFPGGIVDDVDRLPETLALVGTPDPDQGPWIAAAVRELIEEVGIWLGPDPYVDRRDEWVGPAVYEAAVAVGRKLAGERLALFANWVTPLGFPMRFDTRFYAGTVEADLVPDPDTREIDQAMWIDVDEALARGKAEDMIIPFPTRKTLEYLATFADGDALVTHARSLADVMVVLPKVRLADDGSMGIVLPTEAGYDDIDHLGPESREKLTRLADRAKRGGRQVGDEA
jgi:8-oxo-dGTP pyrophosphatase MutT (NUDIX family)